MSFFSYNSQHKIITAIIVFSLVVFQFFRSESSTSNYENGQIKRTGSLKNAKNEGKWIWYYENGNKKIEGSFSKGKRVGVWTTYHKNGKKLTESEYQNDKLNGFSITWDINGNIKEKAQYKDDQLQSKTQEIRQK